MKENNLLYYLQPEFIAEQKDFKFFKFEINS